MMYSKLTSNAFHKILYNVRYCYTTGRYRNHYEVLKLKRGCTPKEIKASYIKLSKENHPDINKSKEAHAEFQRINEAYKVLSNSVSKKNYDLGFSNDHSSYSSHENVMYKEQFGRNPWKDPSFYANRDKSEDAYYEDKPYYGIKGVKRMSNRTVASLCILVAIVAFILQILAINYSYTFRRDILIKTSQETEESLRQLRELATVNGNEKQLELIKLKYEASRKREV